MLRRLDEMRTENFELRGPSSSDPTAKGHASIPAPIAMIPAFTSGAVRSRLPDIRRWRSALLADPMTKLLLDLVQDPSGLENADKLHSLHSIYRQPARSGHFTVDLDGILYMKEIFKDDTKFVKL